MATSVKQMLEAANAIVPKITSAQADGMIAKGNTLQRFPVILDHSVIQYDREAP